MLYRKKTDYESEYFATEGDANGTNTTTIENGTTSIRVNGKVQKSLQGHTLSFVSSKRSLPRLFANEKVTPEGRGARVHSTRK